MSKDEKRNKDRDEMSFVSTNLEGQLYLLQDNYVHQIHRHTQ